MAKKRAPEVKVSVGSCLMFCTEPMVCPLCGIRVPANTEHRCEKKS